MGAAMRARNGRVKTGKEGMIGETGEAVKEFDGQGRVFAFGEVWAARSAEPVAEHAMVRITGIDGLTLIVQPED